MSASDRRVFGLTKEGHEIVRYERAGHWYIEPVNSPVRRVKVTIKQAAMAAFNGEVTARNNSGSPQFWSNIRHLSEKHPILAEGQVVT